MDETKPADSGEKAPKAAPLRWVRQLVVIVIVFLLGAGTMVYLGRHAWNFYLLSQGNQDRSLMAIESANLHSDMLTVTFIRSEPDKPDGAFVLAGHKPAHSNVSDPNKVNTVNEDTVTFDGEEFEILFEATDPEKFPDRSRMYPFKLDWLGREKGSLTLGPINQRAINSITSYRAFLLLTKADGEFYTSDITIE